MKTIILSFKPEVYKRILTGEKIFEHRRAFPNEEIKAYLYVSRPVSAVMGILYLNNRHSLNDWLEEYSYDYEAVERIKKYQIHYKYAMEMPKFVETTGVSLEELRLKVKFLVPRSYYYIDNTPLLKYITENISETGKVVIHESYSKIESDKICIM